MNAITLVRSNLAGNIKSELEHDAFHAPILQKIAQARSERTRVIAFTKGLLLKALALILLSLNVFNLKIILKKEVHPSSLPIV